MIGSLKKMWVLEILKFCHTYNFETDNKIYAIAVDVKKLNNL